MNDAAITVVLTTYDRLEMAKAAFQSVVGQTVAPLEIIVVEDASDSGLEQWIADLGRSDTTYVRHDRNKGLAAARNTGIRAAQGELVAFLDDDDEWLPTRLHEQLSRYKTLTNEQRERLAAIQVGAKILDRDGREVGIRMPANQGNLRDSIIALGAVTPSSSFVFVKRALEDVGGFDESLISGIDHDIWMKLADAGYWNEIIEKPLVILYQDDRPTMMSSTEKRIAGLSAFIDKWTPTYVKWFGDSAGRRYAKRYFIEVIGRLAGKKYSENRLREGFLATKAVFRVAGWSPGLQAYALLCVVRAFAARLFPGLRTAKRAVFRQPSE